MIGPDHLARLQLSFAVEPGDESVGQRIQLVGAPRTWAELVTGESPIKNAEAIASRLAHFKSAAEDLASRLSDPAQSAVRYITPLDQEWPARLEDLGSRKPIGLYVSGPLDIKASLANSISIVGTRSATSYGRHVTSVLAGDLAESGLTIISGAAFGIDYLAHEAALAVSGQTVAVMPAWVLDDYPPSNASLLGQIRQMGLAVSELPIGTHPTRPRFLQRNRLIAALSVATLVIEAPWRSGALSTARQAQSLLRIVMATPGPVTSPMSAGCNRLIREREAELVTSAEDVLELLAASGSNLVATTSLPRRLDELSRLDALVFEAIPAGSGATAKDLTQKLGVLASEGLAALGRLELIGIVARKKDKWAIERDALNLVNS